MSLSNPAGIPASGSEETKTAALLRKNLRAA